MAGLYTCTTVPADLGDGLVQGDAEAQRVGARLRRLEDDEVARPAT
jgi:hypothetical protein